MAPIDLSQIQTVEELQKLSAEIDEEIARRRESERESLLLQVQEAAKRYGVDVNEFLGKAKRHTKSTVRYQNPDDPKQHWSGKGKKPAWLQEKVDAGMPIEVFKVS